MQRQNISELDVFRYYIKLLQKMRDLGQDDIRQIKIKQWVELDEELSSKWSDKRI